MLHPLRLRKPVLRSSDPAHVTQNTFQTNIREKVAHQHWLSKWRTSPVMSQRKIFFKVNQCFTTKNISISFSLFLCCTHMESHGLLSSSFSGWFPWDRHVNMFSIFVVVKAETVPSFPIPSLTKKLVNWKLYCMYPRTLHCKPLFWSFPYQNIRFPVWLPDLNCKMLFTDCLAGLREVKQTNQAKLSRL